MAEPLSLMSSGAVATTIGMATPVMYPYLLLRTLYGYGLWVASLQQDPHNGFTLWAWSTASPDRPTKRTADGWMLSCRSSCNFAAWAWLLLPVEIRPLLQDSSCHCPRICLKDEQTDVMRSSTCTK